jgi:hypothetical protein
VRCFHRNSRAAKNAAADIRCLPVFGSLWSAKRAPLSSLPRATGDAARRGCSRGRALRYCAPTGGLYIIKYTGGTPLN